MDILLQVLVPIASLLLGGGATWMFTVKYARRQAEAEAMEHFQGVYRGMMQDLRSDRDELRKEVGQLRQRVVELEQTNTRILRQLSRLACIKAPSCADCVLMDLTEKFTEKCND